MSSCGAKGTRTPDHSLKADVPDEPRPYIGRQCQPRNFNERFEGLRLTTRGRSRLSHLVGTCATGPAVGSSA